MVDKDVGVFETGFLAGGAVDYARRLIRSMMRIMIWTVMWL
jgi:hypothetical protein